MMTKTRSAGLWLGALAAGVCLGKALNHFSDGVAIVVVIVLLIASSIVQNLDQ